LVPNNEQLKLFRVSKRWYKIMDEVIGVDVEIGRGTDGILWEQQPLETLEPIQILGKVGIRSCKLNSFINDSEVLPKLKHPDLLKVIRIKGFISSRTFETILSGVNNLSILEIDSAAMYHLNFSDITFSVRCLALQFGSSSYRDRDKINDATAEEILSINTIHLLRKSFPELMVLVGVVIVQENMYKQVTEEFVNFLNRHSQTLRYVVIELRESAYDSPHVKRTDIKLPSSQSEHQQIQDVQFEKLEMIHITDECRSKRTSDWMKWTVKTGNLDNAHIVCHISQPLLSQIVMKNEETIIKLVIWWRPDSQTSSLDCGMFQNCLKLTDLSINSIPIRDEASPVANALFHANLLPKNLIRLMIKGLPISCEVCRIICLEQPALQDLNLEGNTDLPGFGVPIQVAREIIRQKKLKYFRIDTGIEAVEGLPSCNESLESAYKVKQRKITGSLQENGEYSVSVH